MFSFDKRLLNMKVIENSIKQLDKRIIVVTLGLCIAVFLIINKGFISSYSSKERFFKQEMTRIRLAKDLIKLKLDFEKVSNLFFEGSDVGLVLSFVNKFLEKEGIAIISVNPQRTEQIGSILVREIFIVVEGRYEQIINLVEGFENAEQFVYIEEIQIRKKKIDFIKIESGYKDPILSANIRIKIFAK